MLLCFSLLQYFYTKSVFHLGLPSAPFEISLKASRSVAIFSFHRRMFPSVRVKVKGLDPGKQYHVAIDVVPVDSKRYRWPVQRKIPQAQVGNGDSDLQNLIVLFWNSTIGSGIAFPRLWELNFLTRTEFQIKRRKGFPLFPLLLQSRCQLVFLCPPNLTCPLFYPWLCKLQ